MRHQNAGTDIGEQGGHRVGNDICVIRAGIGCHLTKKLIQRLLTAGELRVLEKIRPQAHAELPEPELFVGCRLHVHGYGAAPGVAAPGLIHQIHAVATPQKKILKALASVGSAFPCSGGLACPMQKHQRVFPGIHRFLIENIGVIAMQRLPCGLRMQRVIGFFGGNDGAACGKAALLLNDQRRRSLFRRGFGGCRQHSSSKQGKGK